MALARVRRAPTPAGYYVYELIDPRAGGPFYVGKGKGRRAWSHEGAARSGRDPNGVKAEVILQILRSGARPEIRIVRDGLTERDALRLERTMIAEARSSLTNIAAGSRTAEEALMANIREDIRRLKPLCQLVREGASPYRLAMWRDVWLNLLRGHNKLAV